MKRLIAGVDVGNQTTEVALAEIADDGAPRFLAASIAPTTGIKGTFATLAGVRAALAIACAAAGAALESIAELRLNAAVPVVAGVAMQAITSTVLTDSALLGHNPGTPGGFGLAVGRTISITDLAACGAGDGPVIALIPAEVTFDRGDAG